MILWRTKRRTDCETRLRGDVSDKYLFISINQSNKLQLTKAINLKRFVFFLFLFFVSFRIRSENPKRSTNTKFYNYKLEIYGVTYGGGGRRRSSSNKQKKTRTEAKTNPLIDHQQLVLYSWLKIGFVFFFFFFGSKFVLIKKISAANNSDRKTFIQQYDDDVDVSDDPKDITRVSH